MLDINHSNDNILCHPNKQKKELATHFEISYSKSYQNYLHCVGVLRLII